MPGVYKSSYVLYRLIYAAPFDTSVIHILVPFLTSALRVYHMKTKIKIKSILGKVLFEFEKEDNTLRDTVIEAVRSRADLSRANLSGADLCRD